MTSGQSPSSRVTSWMTRPFPTDSAVQERLIPIKEWARQENLTVEGARYRIRRFRIKGYKVKGRWWVDPQSNLQSPMARH